MPLLLCPNDNSSMTTVERDGVQFDMCPSCRGVWLDRGELEKLMAASGPTPAAQGRPWAGYEDRQPRRDYKDNWEYKPGHGHSRKRHSIFDIFD